MLIYKYIVRCRLWQNPKRNESPQVQYNCDFTCLNLLRFDEDFA